MSNKQKNLEFLNSNIGLEELNKLIGSKNYLEEILENKFNKLICSLNKVK